MGPACLHIERVSGVQLVDSATGLYRQRPLQQIDNRVRPLVNVPSLLRTGWHHLFDNAEIAAIQQPPAIEVFGLLIVRCN